MGRQKVQVTDLEHAIINSIIRRMSESGWSELHLATQAGMTPSTLHRMLKGSQNLTLSYLEKVCAAFSIPTSQLIKESERAILGQSRLGESVLPTPPVASLDERRKVSEGLPIFDPVARGLAAKRDERDEDTEQ